MCSFLDKDGNEIMPGDKITYWGKEKAWIVAKVRKVETLSQISTRYNDNNVNEQYIKTRTKMIVDPIQTENPTRPYRSTGTRLVKSENVRKV